jgi:hypothetical protein
VINLSTQGDALGYYIEPFRGKDNAKCRRTNVQTRVPLLAKEGARGRLSSIQPNLDLSDSATIFLQLEVNFLLVRFVDSQLTSLVPLLRKAYRVPHFWLDTGDKIKGIAQSLCDPFRVKKCSLWLGPRVALRLPWAIMCDPIRGQESRVENSVERWTLYDLSLGFLTIRKKKFDESERVLPRKNWHSRV